EDVERKLASVIVAPHTSFAARDFSSRRNVVPSVWAMVNGVKQQPLMMGITREIRLVENRGRDGEASLAVIVPVQKFSQPKQSLCGDCGGGTIDWLVFVEWICRTRAPIA